MARKVTEITLTDGTMVRHKVSGYRGLVDGTTALQNCFTSKGLTVALPGSVESFQYRIAVAGEKLRRIAPARDLEVVEVAQITEIVCVSCESTFRTRPRALNKIGGQCECGNWICPLCLTCSASNGKATKGSSAGCIQQRSRKVKAQANHKRKRAR